MELRSRRPDPGGGRRRGVRRAAVRWHDGGRRPVAGRGRGDRPGAPRRPRRHPRGADRLARGNAEPAGTAAAHAVPRPACGSHRAAVPVLARAGLRAAAGAARPVRRPARSAGARRPRRLSHLPVVRRAGLRRADRGRPGHAGPRPGLGPGGRRELRRPGARGSDRRRCTRRRRQFRDLDLARVAIRGWSFGGYLAALAVLRRPDVFHAAIAGAPVTDRRLYDTHYTERYLGDPATAPMPTTTAHQSGTRNGCAAAGHVPADDDHPRAGRRQRGGRAHPAAVVRAARRGLCRTPSCRCPG